MKITIIGTGYVGLSLGTLLSKYYEVVGLDIDEKKVDSINNRISPIEDPGIIYYFKNKNLNLIATTDKITAYKDSKFIIIATPTNYDVETNEFRVKGRREGTRRRFAGHGRTEGSRDRVRTDFRSLHHRSAIGWFDKIVVRRRKTDECFVDGNGGDPNIFSNGVRSGG